MQKKAHPTSQRLLETATALQDAHPGESITVEMVLSASGISKGSLYHHYHDFDDLLDRCHVARFARQVDESIALIDEVLGGAETPDDFYNGLAAITRATQARPNSQFRTVRVAALAKAGERESMRIQLAREQQRLTNTLADIARGAQERGFIVSTLDPYAVAVMVQAYTLGRVIDDITDKHVDEQAWYSMVDQLVAAVFMGDPTLARRADE